MAQLTYIRWKMPLLLTVTGIVSIDEASRFHHFRGTM